MVKLGLVLMSLTLLVGCSSKKEQSFLNEFNKKKNYYKYLQKTEKVQFKEGNVTQLLVTATYMNKPTIDIDDKSDEVFLVGVYNESHTMESLTSEDFNIALKNVKTREEIRRDKREKRGKKNKYLTPIDIKIVNKGNPILKGISFVSRWTQFYLIHYKHIAGNKLLLRVKSKKTQSKKEAYHTKVLHFSKVAKYAQ